MSLIRWYLGGASRMSGGGGKHSREKAQIFWAKKFVPEMSRNLAWLNQGQWGRSRWGKDGDIQEARANGKTLWGQWKDFVFFSENDGKQLVTFEQRHDLIWFMYCQNYSGFSFSKDCRGTEQKPGDHDNGRPLKQYPWEMSMARTTRDHEWLSSQTFEGNSRIC